MTDKELCQKKKTINDKQKCYSQFEYICVSEWRHSHPACQKFPSLDLNSHQNTLQHSAHHTMFNYCAQHPLECCMIAPLREPI